jgi:predicted HAD superfamily Cof-like phosphohydrolase
MNKHLKLVREFHDAFSFPQAEQGKNVRLSEMDIILRQALLMEEGSELFRAIKAGDMVEILAGMINLSYCALGAIAIQGADVLDRPVSWQHDGFVISLMRLFSDKINYCVSGNPDNYSEVYGLCVYLSRSFINADFDKAFQLVHDSKMSRLGKGGKLPCENAEEILKSKFFKTPDLSECLYE